ncbi:MAG: DUF3810 domain-containing protein [Lachnospiraceae bacterium]|nr:DUF3810 domain-containing protein [Lachnospiraceae bacterium]
MKKIEFKKIREKIKDYCPLPARILILIGLAAGIVNLILINSVAFSDFLSDHVSYIIRLILAKLTNWFPMSFAELLLMLSPLILALLIVLIFKISEKEVRYSWRFAFSMIAVGCFAYSVFVFGFAPGYYGTVLTDKLEVKREKVSAEQLYETALFLVGQCDEVSDEVDFSYGSSSVMPYSLDEMNGRLNDAYAKAAEKYGFFHNFRSDVKYVVMSEWMSYTHITGVYTFFTGEANINVVFPDYTLPYTAAHELSHQRGISREEEANFMAYLVCMESDDPYIRYSGAFNLLEYVLNALYSADASLYSEIWYGMDIRYRYEMRAYNEFFEKYRENVAADVSEAVNDHYLESHGQTEGTRSYGLVVDLAVAYLLPDKE